MLSIITPIFNQIEHNRLFLRSLKAYTYHPYEIIIIDNNSSDDSASFFKNNGCKVIRNKRNYCYSDSMNMGIEYAKYDILCFLNNDIYVGVDWDKHLLDAMETYNLQVVSPIGIQQMPTLNDTRKKTNKWKRLGGKKYKHTKEVELERLINSMYGDWQTFCAYIKNRYKNHLMEGIVGNTVVVKRELLGKVNNWDPMVMEADYDFYLKSKKRELEVGDVSRPMVVCWSYVHHFINATIRSTKKPFECDHPILNYKEKWTHEELKRLWPFPHQIEKKPSLVNAPSSYLKYKLKKILGKFDWEDSYYN